VVLSALLSYTCVIALELGSLSEVNTPRLRYEIKMESLASDAAPPLRPVKFTSNSTFGEGTFPEIRIDFYGLCLLLLAITVVLITYQWFFPPFNKGLKPLPGPVSTLPYIGRVHDVDRMQAWTAMHRFSKQYNGLFSCTMGGETHIWVAREDVAQDLLVKHAELSSARADLGAMPGVTEDFKYLPLMGYTGT
jgi:hypothetical protein